MNVDYMVCHLGWYDSVASAREAFRGGAARAGNRGEETRALGDEARLALAEGALRAVGDRPQQNSYEVTFRSGPLLFEAGIVAVATWDRERLEAFARALDERFRTRRADIEATNGLPRLLKDKLTDPSRAPVCRRTCQVHGEKFSAVLLPTGGGLRIDLPGTEEQEQATKAYWEARQRLFPNAAPAYIDVGCIHDSPHEKDWACACSACTAAEGAWRAVHEVSGSRRP